MNSQSLEWRLHRAAEHQYDYTPNEEVQRYISRVAFVALVAPTRAGKSSIINSMQHQYPESYHYVYSYTTRSPRKDDDPGTMRFIEPTEQAVSGLLDQIDDGELVQYAVNPATRQFYATATDSYDPAKVNLMPTLSSVIAYLSELGFKSMRTVAIVPDIELWKSSLDEIGYSDTELHKRLEEAHASISWCLEHVEDIVWLHNKAGHLDESAQKLHDTLQTGESGSNEARAIAEQLKDEISVMLDRTKGES